MPFRFDAAEGECQLPPREVQLRLFPADSPLVRRLGAAFFRAVPELPGVYRMRDREGRLIYVGKARNLRQRLGSYRYLQGAPRKTVRLVHQVASVEWEVCRSEQEAILRENALLRTHRPRFNRVGTWPRAYQFVRLWRCPDGFGLQVESDRNGKPAPQNNREGWFHGDPTPGVGSGPVFGAFKFASRAIPSVLRLLWAAMHGGCDCLPRTLLQTRGSRWFLCERSGAADWYDGLEQFLAGTSDGLLERLTSKPNCRESAFDAALWAADMEAATDFFHRGPRRNEELRCRAGRGRALFGPEELDDLLVIHRFSSSPERTARSRKLALAAILRNG